MKADTGARGVLLDNAVSDSKLNERIDTEHHFTLERAAGAPPRLLVLGMAIVALGVGLPALSGQFRANLIERKDAGVPAPIVLAQVDEKAIEEKIDRLWEQAKSEQASGQHLEALVTVGEALGLSPDSAELLAFRDELVTQHDAELNTRRDDYQVSGLADLARQEIAAGDYAGAQGTIARGLHIDPSDAALIELNEQVVAALAAEADDAASKAAAEEQRQIATEVAQLEAQTRSQLDQGQLQTALASVDQALVLAPDNPQLKTLRDDVVTRQQATRDQQHTENQVSESLQQAQTALDTGDLDQAQEHLQVALQLAPEAHNVLALKQSVDDAQQAAAEQEGKIRESALLATEARDALANSELDTAQAQLTKAQALTPEDETLLALETEIKTAQADADAEAKAQLEQQVAALKEEAASLLEQGEYETALEKASQALELAPTNTELAELATSIEAQLAAEQERQRIANQVDELVQKAQAALDSGDLDQAQQQVQAALELAPEAASALALKNEIDGAAQAAAEGERITREAEALATEARNALAAEQLDTAQEKLTQALALSPADENLLALRTEIETARAEAQAQEQLRQQVATLKDEAKTLQNQGEFDAALEKVAEARKLTAEDSDLAALATAIEKQLAAEQERQHIAAEVARLSEQARSQLDAGEFESAVADVDEALALAPEDSELTTLREEISTRQQTVLEQERIDKQANDLLKQAQKALDTGDLDQAAQQVEAALELAPQAATALALQQTVEEAQQAAAERERERIARESEALTLEARDALAAGQLDSAQEKVTQALELTPDSAGLLALQKEVETARADAQAQEQLRQQVAALKDEAAMLQSQGDYAGALAKIAEASKLASDDSELAAITKNIESARAAEQERIEQAAAPYIQRGDDQLSRKDVASARLYYETAFSEGSVKAARLLGMTYDPVSIQELGIVGMRGDVEKALYWYEIARDGGDPVAAQRISALRSQ